MYIYTYNIVAASKSKSRVLICYKEAIVKYGPAHFARHSNDGWEYRVREVRRKRITDQIRIAESEQMQTEAVTYDIQSA